MDSISEMSESTVLQVREVNKVPAIGFDYSAIDPKISGPVKTSASNIQRALGEIQASIFVIGKELLAVKEKIGHGHFLRFIEDEFHWSDKKAERYMSVVRRFGNQIRQFVEFQPSVLYELAAKNTSESVVERALEQHKDEGFVTLKEIKSWKKQENQTNFEAATIDAIENISGEDVEINKLDSKLDELEQEIDRLTNPSPDEPRSGSSPYPVDLVKLQQLIMKYIKVSRDLGYNLNADRLLEMLDCCFESDNAGFIVENDSEELVWCQIPWISPALLTNPN
jgi:hypothetical protein